LAASSEEIYLFENVFNRQNDNDLLTPFLFLSKNLFLLKMMMNRKLVVAGFSFSFFLSISLSLSLSLCYFENRFRRTRVKPGIDLQLGWEK
jgi:hypothetical protein